MPAEQSPTRTSWRNTAIGATALFVAAALLVPEVAHAGESNVLTDKLSSDEVPDLGPLDADVHSAFVSQASFDHLAASVARSAHAIDELVRSLSQVSDMHSVEVTELLAEQAELARVQSALDSIESSQVLRAMDAQGFSPAHLSHKAVELSRTIPHINAAKLSESYKQLALMYNNLDYGEVLYTDASGRINKSIFSDLVPVNGDAPDRTLTPLERLGRIPDKSALLPPTLTHQTLDLLRATGDHSKWFVPSGAFEHADDHGTNSCHIAPVNKLQCVDLALVENKTDPVELGKMLLAAKDNPNVSFFQLEVGKNGNVSAMQESIKIAWSGKVDDETLKFMMAKVVPNGSGIHVHAKFFTPEYSKTLSMLK